MRPSILDPLFAPATSLPGVGPKVAPLVDRLVGEPGQPARIVDLLFHLPTGGVSRRVAGKIIDAPIGEPVTLLVTVTHHQPGPLNRSKAPYRVVADDDSGDVALVFFSLPRARIERLLPIGAARCPLGKLRVLWTGPPGARWWQPGPDRPTSPSSDKHRRWRRSMARPRASPRG